LKKASFYGGNWSFGAKAQQRTFFRSNPTRKRVSMVEIEALALKRNNVPFYYADFQQVFDIWCNLVREMKRNWVFGNGVSIISVGNNQRNSVFRRTKVFSDWFLGGNAPKFDSFVITATSKGLTIGTEGDWINREGMSGEGGFQLATADIPDFDSFVPTATSKGLTIGTEGDWTNPGGMSGEGGFQFATADIPDFDSLVNTATSKGLTIGTEGDWINRVGMSGEGGFQLTTADIPDFDSFVRTATSKGLTIGTEGDWINLVGMSGDGGFEGKWRN